MPLKIGEYKILQNTTAYTPAPGENEVTSYSSHNPTVLRDLIFDSWHSGGEQAIDLSDPGHPVQAGWFSPTPLATVANEDPALSRGPNKVVMWSFPIIHDGRGPSQPVRTVWLGIQRNRDPRRPVSLRQRDYGGDPCRAGFSRPR
jgi:hypothetical protein